MTHRSGRNITAAARRNGAAMLAVTDLCHLCHHHGAHTSDHIISARDWPRDPDGRHLPGLDDPDNLAPAHGTIGNHALNPCPVCGQLCNQSRGARTITSPRSRDW